MKKIFTILSAAALLCACNKNVQPQAGYGYIDLGVSADESMNTKATVGDLTNWTLKVDGAAYGGASYGYAAGSHTVSASTEAIAYSNRGTALYSGSTTVTVSAGSSVTATIDCGKAQNARFKVVFDPSFTGMTGVSGYSLTTTDSRAIVFNASNTDPAYYEPATSVAYKINYTFNSTPKEITGNIVLGDAATEKTITIKGNSNGTITITVSVDDTFTGAGNTDITIDANTGNQA